MILSKIANLTKMKRYLAYFMFIFIILLLLFGVFFLISFMKYKQREAIRDNVASVNLSNISLNGEIYSDPLNPIHARKKNAEPLLIIINKKEVKTKKDITDAFGEDYIVVDSKWVFQDRENKLKMYIAFEEDDILSASVSKLSEIYVSKNNLKDKESSVFSSYGNYFFLLRTWPSSAKTKILSMNYLYWKDYILIPLVISLTLLPLIFALVYKKIWIIILNVVFYVLYYIIMMLSVILYT